MSQLQIELEGGRTSYDPGETLRGTGVWSLAAPAEALEFRLFWFTQGKAISEAKVVETRRIEKPALKGREDFEFAAPAFPFSFRGELFELGWGLELVSLPSQEVSRQLLIIAPGAQPVVLPTLPPPPPPLSRAA